jgi:DNA-binding winged helix-turn-helix (wHTH) protein
MKEGPSPQVVRFGVFEMDLRSGELRKQGFRIRLQEQPFRILTLLVERPGEVVSREELQQKLWPEGTFVDFEKGLNIAVRKLRDALGDSAESPRFVETLSRRGYRFIASVQAREVEVGFVSAHDRATASMVPRESRGAESASAQLSENQELLWDRYPHSVQTSSSLGSRTGGNCLLPVCLYCCWVAFFSGGRCAAQLLRMNSCSAG